MTKIVFFLNIVLFILFLTCKLTQRIATVYNNFIKCKYFILFF